MTETIKLYARKAALAALALITVQRRAAIVVGGAALGAGLTLALLRCGG